MKLLKKTLAFLVVFVCAFILVACAKKDPELEEKADKILLGDTSKQTDDLALPKMVEGNPDFPITWTSSNTNVIDIREYQDFENKDKTKFIKGYVELGDEEKKVTLTATVEHNGNKTNRTFEVTVLKDDYKKMSVADAKKYEEGKKDVALVRVDGTVCYTTSGGYIVTDGTDSIYVYGSNHDRTVGEQVIVRGLWTIYNNMPQLKNASAKAIDIDESFELSSLREDGNLGTAAGLTISSSGCDADSCTKVFNITAKVVDNSADSYNPIRLLDPKDPSKYLGVTKYNDDDVKNYLKENCMDKVINCDVITYYGYKGEWCVLVDMASITETTVTLTDDEKVNASKILLEMKYNNMEVSGDLELDDTTTYGATVAWSSSNTALISDAGKFTAPEQDTEVTLTAVITCGSASTTATLKVKALQPKEVQISKITAEGFYIVNATVVALYARGYFVSDGTGVMCVYLNKESGFEVGKGLTLTGKVSKYNGNFQFDKTVVAVDNANAPKVETPEAKVWTATEADEYLKSGKIGEFISIEGTVAVSGNYYNLTIAGATTAQGSVQYPLSSQAEALKAADGKKVRVTGYVIGVSSSKYVNICMTKLEVLE